MTDSTLQAMTQPLLGVTNPLFHAKGEFVGNILEHKEKGGGQMASDALKLRL